MAVPDPWTVLSDTDLLLVVLPISERGRYYDRRRCIVLRSGMTLVEQRVTLWHELVHARRRDTACLLTEKAHVSVDREAARWAMPVDDLVEAWRGDPHISVVADELKTTEHLLGVRMRSLHPAERGVLRRAAQRRESVA